MSKISFLRKFEKSYTCKKIRVYLLLIKNRKKIISFKSATSTVNIIWNDPHAFGKKCFWFNSIFSWVQVSRFMKMVMTNLIPTQRSFMSFFKFGNRRLIPIIGSFWFAISNLKKKKTEICIKVLQMTLIQFWDEIDQLGFTV